MWVTKLLISPVKIRIFCPRTTKFGPKLAFLPGLAGSDIKIMEWRNQDNGQVENEVGIIYALLSCPDTV